MNPLRPSSSIGRALETMSRWITVWAGSSLAFTLALGVIIVWIVSGPIFDYSDTWQLVINTGTTVVTFLMVFLIQRAQNKDAMALQLKLNEIVAAIEGASNRLINIEDLDENELKTLHEHYAKLSDLADQEIEVLRSHSIEEAGRRHSGKSAARKGREPVHSPR